MIFLRLATLAWPELFSQITACPGDDVDLFGLHQLAVQAPVLDCLSQVIQLNILTVCQICYGPAYFDDPVKGPGTQGQFFSHFFHERLLISV